MHFLYHQWASRTNPIGVAINSWIDSSFIPLPLLEMDTRLHFISCRFLFPLPCSILYSSDHTDFSEMEKIVPQKG
jgi:hypothetical protein